MRFEFSVDNHVAEIEGLPPLRVAKAAKAANAASTLATLATLADCPAPELTFFRDVCLNPYSDLATPERIEARRQQLLEMMEEDDQPRAYYFLTDTESHRDFVILAMAKRGVATWEFSIEKERYDVGVLLELIKRIEHEHFDTQRLLSSGAVRSKRKEVDE